MWNLDTAKDKYCHALREICIVHLTIIFNFLYSLFTKLHVGASCPWNTMFILWIQPPVESRPLSLNAPPPQLKYRVSSWHQGLSPQFDGGIYLPSNPLLCREVTFKINQWKLDFPSALGDDPQSLLTPPPVQHRLGPWIEHSSWVLSGPLILSRSSPQ